MAIQEYRHATDPAGKPAGETLPVSGSGFLVVDAPGGVQCSTALQGGERFTLRPGMKVCSQFSGLRLFYPAGISGDVLLIAHSGGDCVEGAAPPTSATVAPLLDVYLARHAQSGDYNVPPMGGALRGGAPLGLDLLVGAALCTTGTQVNRFGGLVSELGPNAKGLACSLKLSPPLRATGVDPRPDAACYSWLVDWGYSNLANSEQWECAGVGMTLSHGGNVLNAFLSGPGFGLAVIAGKLQFLVRSAYQQEPSELVDLSARFAPGVLHRTEFRIIAATAAEDATLEVWSGGEKVITRQFTAGGPLPIYTADNAATAWFGFAVNYSVDGSPVGQVWLSDARAYIGPAPDGQL